jgi:hypothetical protein
MASGDHDSLVFEIVSEEVKYSRYLTVFDRVVRYTHKETNEVGGAGPVLRRRGAAGAQAPAAAATCRQPRQGA